MASREWKHRKQPGPTILEAIRRVMPRDRTFTLPEIVGSVQALLPRPVGQRTIRVLFQELDHAGEVRRVAKGHHGVVQWAVSDGKPRETPLEGLCPKKHFCPNNRAAAQIIRLDLNSPCDPHKQPQP
jgi:hypothetical protein